jgi:hypothetical protein
VQQIALRFHLPFLSVLRSGYKLQPEHYTAPLACRVLDLAAVLRLAANSNVIWQADVNPISSEAFPFRNAFIGPDYFARLYMRLAMSIDGRNNVAHKWPTM